MGFESFFASKGLTVAAAAIAFLAAASLLTIVFRFTFRRRLRLPRNGRARLPRLGTVDAFDLDRQRQLVIVRRDNVEHLLMIGGPNDVVIEADIIRAESRDPRDLREARIRDKELRDAPSVAAGISWPSPAEAPPPNTPQRKMPFPPAAGLELGDRVDGRCPDRGIRARFRATDRFTTQGGPFFLCRQGACRRPLLRLAKEHRITPSLSTAAPVRRKSPSLEPLPPKDFLGRLSPLLFCGPRRCARCKEPPPNRPHQAHPRPRPRMRLPQARFPALRRSQRPRRLTWHSRRNFPPRPRRNPRDQLLRRLPPVD